MWYHCKAWEIAKYTNVLSEHDIINSARRHVSRVVQITAGEVTITLDNTGR
jgi:hypothetical protein